MDFWSENFLKNHISKIIKFYYPSCIDKEIGGYINQFYDDGKIADYETKHIVGTCRFIYNFSTCYKLFSNKNYLEAAIHGLNFLENHHKRNDGSYIWVLKKDKVEDNTRYCYGMAFALLAYSSSAKANINKDHNIKNIYETFKFLNKFYYEKEYEMYVDVIDGEDIYKIDKYRGQNANMHLCEALISSYEATKDIIFIERGYSLANKICNDLAVDENYIWEHYNSNWKHDWKYNKDDPKNLFRPYGFLPGHFFEWAKLLLNIYRYKNEKWLIKKAKNLFKLAVEISWDNINGGIFYTFDKNYKILDTDKYYWVHSEMIASASGLAKITNNNYYRDWYLKCWKYVISNLSDEKYGGWFRVLDKNNNKYDNYKSPPAKTDYHPVAACNEALIYINKI